MQIDKKLLISPTSMTSNGFQASYSNDRPPSSQGSGGGEGDVSADPASSGFFVNDYKKHEDLKQMLDTNKDALKLEAMKRIIGMVAKGKDASDLFPAVVKNVVAKNIEVKKLVYVYLSRYAEEQQDLALLSISSFQRALKDPNQLIRASALRVLSSIRVPMIVPIMMLAIKDSVMDMSPYVRKTAAHAIPKLYSIEPEQKDQLMEVIEKLLGDKTTLVAGSAIQAFEEVCPERIDLIHKNFRKLCNLLVDVDEWGQVAIINMLTRYCRTQFLDPNEGNLQADVSNKAFYASSEDSDAESRPEETDRPKKKPYVMDPDHRLLLRNTKPLLSSRNAAVVMAVAMLYHHCAPKSEVVMVSRALIRLLRSHKEVQFIVLSNIASMSVQRKDLFEPFLKSFYVRSNDPTHVKLLKLEILTNLATETNISIILREFQTYVTSSDQEFAAATIQAIGRCASNIAEVTDTCLNGLVSLLSNRNETVVGESVVVIKKLLQMQSSEHKDIISHLARLSDSITVPLARASILWLIGEYSDRVPRMAPDVLRKMAKSFTEEEDIVKLQILNLAAKLCITNPKQTKLLCQYVFNLAKYDQNYDIRDRSRFMRALIMPGDKAGQLAKHAKKIFLSTKPAPTVESRFKDHDQHQLGTLTHVINKRAQGYQDLPDWPETPPDPSVRHVAVATPWSETSTSRDKVDDGRKKKKKSFYSDDESTTTSGPDSSGSSTEDSSSSSSSESHSSSSSSSSTESSSDDSSDSADSEASGGGDKTDGRKKVLKQHKKKEVATEDLLAGPSLVDVAPKSESSKKSEKIPASKSPMVKATRKSVGTSGGESSSGSSSSSTGSSSSDSSGTESDIDEPAEETIVKPKAKKKPSKPMAASKENAEKSRKKPPPEETKKPLAMLLDLDDFGPPVQAPVMLPGALLVPGNQPPTAEVKPKPNYTNIMTTAFVPHIEHELLNKFSGQGLSATYRFTRTVSIFSPKMTSVELTFTNTGDGDIEHIRVGNKKLKPGMELHEFPEVVLLAKNCTTSTLMAIDFNDTTQAAQFEVISNNKKLNVQIVAPVGELLQQDTLMESDFLSAQSKLSGMNENSASLTLDSTDAKFIQKAVLTVANVSQVPSSDEKTHLFAGKTVHSSSLLLVSIKLTEKKAKVKVNCEKMVIGSMLLRDIKKELSS